MMRSCPRRLLLGLSLVLTLSGPAEGRHLSALGIQELRETLVAPVFALPNLADQPVTLTEFRGKLVLLNFWATWCPPCVAEMPDLERLYREFKAEGFVIVAVSIDTQGKKVVAPFWEKTGLTFPSLLDTSGEVATRYGVRVLPASFLISPEGEIIARILGPRDWHGEKARAIFKDLLLEANRGGKPR
ncbi:MAG: TlpA family protein disulfide reductase [Candidatus Rokubacteria bacterium]|nr:TlpA family protein disulfide reductase [Candidatus Rokubacteria bacterium]